MNRKGFTLIEFLGCMAILGVVLALGLYVTRGTLSTTLSTLTEISENEVYETAKTYVLENNITWIEANQEYTCVTVQNLVDAGYFKNEEVATVSNNIIKITRDNNTKVINDVKYVSKCN